MEAPLPCLRLLQFLGRGDGELGLGWSGIECMWDGNQQKQRIGLIWGGGEGGERGMSGYASSWLELTGSKAMCGAEAG